MEKSEGHPIAMPAMALKMKNYAFTIPITSIINLALLMYIYPLIMLVSLTCFEKVPYDRFNKKLVLILHT
jgi:positive regulator of sigma E activity